VSGVEQTPRGKISTEVKYLIKKFHHLLAKIIHNWVVECYRVIPVVGHRLQQARFLQKTSCAYGRRYEVASAPLGDARSYRISSDAFADLARDQGSLHVGCGCCRFAKH
jgi:hypothetical protein